MHRSTMWQIKTLLSYKRSWYINALVVKTLLSNEHAQTIYGNNAIIGDPDVIHLQKPTWSVRESRHATKQGSLRSREPPGRQMPIKRSPERSPSAARVTYDGSSHQPGESSSMMSTPAAEEVHTGVASAVRLPSFWKENPHLWFAQVESAFVIHRITNDETKFRYVILHLDPGVLPLVALLLRHRMESDMSQSKRASLQSWAKPVPHICADF